eukprot:Colp12_sorted_trinity150504_noHs@35498
MSFPATLLLFFLFGAFANGASVRPAVNFNESVKVSGHTWAFASLYKAGGATVTWLEKNLKTTAAEDGYFEFNAQPGDEVTLVGEKFGFHTTYTGTVKVPEEGAIGLRHEVTIQMPEWPVYEALILVLPATADKTKCQIVVTVAAKNKTLYHDGPQGEEGATVTIEPSMGPEHGPFYLGIFDGLTNPLVRGLTSTSLDGGVIFFNVEPRDEPYIVRAHKEGVQFTESRMRCVAGALVNASPPNGPTVL